MKENWNCIVFKTMLFKVRLQQLNLYPNTHNRISDLCVSLVLTLESCIMRQDLLIYFQVTQVTACPLEAVVYCGFHKLKQEQSDMVWTASRCCRNTWEGNLNQSWSQEVTWSSGQSSIGLLKNRPWCQFHVKVMNFKFLPECFPFWSSA